MRPTESFEKTLASPQFEQLAGCQARGASIAFCLLLLLANGQVDVALGQSEPSFAPSPYSAASNTPAPYPAAAPSAIISTGSSNPVGSDAVGPESTTGLRPHGAPVQAAWTADRSPLSPVEPARLQNTSDSQTHMPLAPPTERLTGEKPKGNSSTLQMLVSIVSSLLLVVGLFLGVAWCYRKTLGTTLAGGLPKQVVQVVGRTSISTRQQMVLVRFGSKLLLVSVIQGEARTLSEINDPLEVDQLLGLCESGQPGSSSQSFKSILLQEGKR